MSCNHVNPAGYQFCGSCGAALEFVRCRCGFVVAAGAVFCGRCGASLSELATGLAAGNDHSAMANDQRFDLERLAQQATLEKRFIESSHKVRVTQDDIRKLLTTRRKKFR